MFIDLSSVDGGMLAFFNSFPKFLQALCGINIQIAMKHDYLLEMLMKYALNMN